jgi:hypothetical protein
LIVLGVVGLLVLARVAVSDHKTIDKSTFCETAGPTAVTAILIDATDSITPLQKVAVTNRLNVLLKELRPNERVDVFSIRPNANPLKPEFSMCRPANADETSIWNANKNDADKHFSKMFVPSLNRTLQKLLGTPPASSSPIMEAIHAAAVKSLDASDLQTDSSAFTRRLILVSDLLQNSPALSQLHDPGSWTQFRDSAEMRSVSSDLTNTTVTVLYLTRQASPSQGRRHVAFWDAWFAEQGVADDNVIPV